MKKSKDGAIVNVGSIAGITGAGSSMPYAVSKSAVHGLTKSLAHALAPEIRVSGVAPGAVATRWWAGREEKMKSMIGSLLLQCIAEPDDVAKLICSLIEQESPQAKLSQLTADRRCKERDAGRCHLYRFIYGREEAKCGFKN